MDLVTMPQLSGAECHKRSGPLFPSEYPGLHGQPAGIHCPLEGGLTKAYDEITVAEEDTCKTAVTIPFVFYEFTHIPIGL